jgi:hypothetical protein
MSDPVQHQVAEVEALHAMLDFIPRRGSGLPAGVSISYARDLAPADLATLVSGAIGSTTPPIARLKQTHHNIARLLADGSKAVEVSAITGYSQSRISILQRDPAFAELVAYYREQAHAQYVDVHSRLAEVGLGALYELRERLDETPETFTHKELIAVMESTMDRSCAPSKNPKFGQGPAPGGGVPSVTINFVAPPDIRPEITIDAVLLPA